jgi:precorrin-8X/cobalt-precorrin-8 methylmutase
MNSRIDYIHDGAQIYARSFATIRAESNLARFTPEQEKIAVRMIHACGMVELADDIEFSPDFVAAARDALQRGAPILCDSNMVAALFRLLEMIDEGAPPPAAIIGMPVGFVGAAESKEALREDGRVPFVIVKGRKGGSAMAAAAINALASEQE